MRRISIASGSLAFFVVLAAAASAWGGELASPVMTIAAVRATAQSGDYVVVEGHVAGVETGHGNRVIVIFEDATGSVPMAVPNHLQRKFGGSENSGGTGPTGVDPKIGARARVGGKWDHEHMNDENWGIQVQRVDRLDD
jgi:hypothetical protein